MLSSRKTYICILFSAICLTVSSQEDTFSATLEYYNNENGFIITQEANSEFETTKFPGIKLVPGDRIISESSNIELQFTKTESTLLLRELSTLEYTAENSEETRLFLPQGRMRINAKEGSNFIIESPDTITRFSKGSYIMDYSQEKTWHVLEGSLEVITKSDAAVTTIPENNSGILQNEVKITELSDKQLAQLNDEYFFTWFEQLAGNDTKQLVNTGDNELSPSQVNQEPLKTGPVHQKYQSGDKLFQWTPLSEKEKKFRFGFFFDTGVSTLLDKTYINIALRPRFSVGRFSMELYLPLQVSSDFLSKSAFILPDGNMPWSFGSDYNWSTDLVGASLDLINDVITKIHYIRFGTLKDPLFLYMGHLENITMGYGLTINRYDNNPVYPNVQRNGFMILLDIDYWGIQLLTGDLARHPGFYAFRTFVRPFKRKYRMEIGLGVASEFALGNDLQQNDSENAEATWIKLIQDEKIGFAMFNADLKLPLITPQNPLSPLAIIAETSFILPLDDIQPIYDSRMLNPWPKIGGILAGIYGEVETKSWFSIAYQLDARYYGSLFIDKLINAQYTTKGKYEYGKLISDVINNPDSLDNSENMLSISFSANMLLFNMLFIDVLYMLPMKSVNGAYTLGENDQLEIGVKVAPENFFIEFEAFFQRKKLISYISNPGASNFMDTNTTLNAALHFKFGATILSIIGSTQLQRETDGALSIDSNGSIINGGSLQFKVSFGM